MAKGAAESGVAESYMCAKVARNPLVQASCAAYLGEFEAQEGANNIQKGTQWLVSSAAWVVVVAGGGGRGAGGWGQGVVCM